VNKIAKIAEITKIKKPPGWAVLKLKILISQKRQHAQKPMKQPQSQRDISHEEMPFWWNGHIAVSIFITDVSGKKKTKKCEHPAPGHGWQPEDLGKCQLSNHIDLIKN